MKYNEGKEIITRESIHAVVLKKIKSERNMWIYSLVLILLLAAFTGYTVGLIVDNVVQAFFLPESMYTIIFALAGMPYFAVRIGRVQKKYKRAKNREYSILEDAVYRVADDEYVGFENKWQRFFSPSWSKADREYVDVIYFETLGRLVSTQNILNYTLPGDVFYVVVFDTKCEPPIIAYSKKIYEFKDN